MDLSLSFKRTLSIGLAAAVFVTQVALPSAAEANMWAERKRAVSGATPGALQLAALPAPAPRSIATVFNDLPSVGGQLSTMVTPTSRRLARLAAPLREVVGAVPLTHGLIQDVVDAGRRDYPPVVLVQDVHLNHEAQLNIAGILQSLIDARQVGRVGVEGAFGPFDFRPFRKFPRTSAARAVIDDLLRQHLIAAPSYVGLTSAIEPPVFVGVDDSVHYDANVAALHAARAQAPDARRRLADIKRTLAERKALVFPTDLAAFDARRASFRRGEIGLGAYLTRLADGDADVDLVVQRFLEAHAMESRLDFDRVERERRMVIENLAGVMTDAELSNLIAYSVAYKAGRLGFGDYYQLLRDLCSENGIALRKTPHFDQYIRYVLLSDGIQASELFEAVRRLETAQIARLARTAEERALAQAGDLVERIEKLLTFSLTPDDWETYNTFPPETWATEAGGVSLSDFRADVLPPFEAFYEEADRRSRTMVETLLSDRSKKASALVLGGFHAPLVSRLLRERGISHVTVSPRVTKFGDGAGSSYLSIFARDKAPLDRLFAGEKLFLASNHAAVGAAGAPALMNRLLEAQLSVLPENESSPTRQVTHEARTYEARYSPGTPAPKAGFKAGDVAVVLLKTGVIASIVQGARSFVGKIGSELSATLEVTSKRSVDIADVVPLPVGEELSVDIPGNVPLPARGEARRGVSVSERRSPSPVPSPRSAWGGGPRLLSLLPSMVLRRALSEFPYFIPVSLIALFGRAWLPDAGVLALGLAVHGIMSIAFGAAHERGRDGASLTVGQRAFVGLAGFAFGGVLLIPAVATFAGYGAPAVVVGFQVAYNVFASAAKRLGDRLSWLEPLTERLPHATISDEEAEEDDKLQDEVSRLLAALDDPDEQVTGFVRLTALIKDPRFSGLFRADNKRFIADVITALIGHYNGDDARMQYKSLKLILAVLEILPVGFFDSRDRSLVARFVSGVVGDIERVALFWRFLEKAPDYATSENLRAIVGFFSTAPNLTRQDQLMDAIRVFARVASRQDTQETAAALIKGLTDENRPDRVVIDAGDGISKAIALTDDRIIRVASESAADEERFARVSATLAGAWRRYEAEREKPTSSAFADTFFWNALALLVDQVAPDPNEDAAPQPIDLQNAAGAFGVSAALASAVWVLGEWMGAWTITGWPAVALLAVPAVLFGVLLLTVAFFRTAERIAGSSLPARPLLLSLWGGEARAVPGTAFVAYDPATKSFQLNPALYALLAFNIRQPFGPKRVMGAIVRFSVHVVLFALHVPGHEGRHARGEKREWVAFLDQGARWLLTAGVALGLYRLIPGNPAWILFAVPMILAASYAAAEMRRANAPSEIEVLSRFFSRRLDGFYFDQRNADLVENAITVLTPYLKSADPALRARSATVFRLIFLSLGYADFTVPHRGPKEAVRGLIVNLADEDERVRTESLWAVAEFFSSYPNGDDLLREIAASDAQIKTAIKGNVAILVEHLGEESADKGPSMRTSSHARLKAIIERLPPAYFGAEDRDFVVDNLAALVRHLKRHNETGAGFPRPDIFSLLISKTDVEIFSANDSEIDDLLSSAADAMIDALSDDSEMLVSGSAESFIRIFPMSPRLKTRSSLTETISKLLRVLEDGDRPPRLIASADTVLAVALGSVPPDLFDGAGRERALLPRLLSLLIGKLKRESSGFSTGGDGAVLLATLFKVAPRSLTRETLRAVLGAMWGEAGFRGHEQLKLLEPFAGAAADGDVRSAAATILKGMGDTGPDWPISFEKDALSRVFAAAGDSDALYQMLLGLWGKYEDWRTKADNDPSALAAAEAFFWNAMGLVVRSVSDGPADSEDSSGGLMDRMNAPGLLDGFPGGAHRESPRPIRLRSALGAVAVSGALAAGMSALIVLSGAGDVFGAWQAVVMVTVVPALFGTLAAFVLFVRLFERWAGPFAPTGPVVMTFAGRTVRPSPGTAFVQYDPVSSSYVMNPALHVLISPAKKDSSAAARGAWNVVRFLTHLWLNFLQVPRHEHRHAEGAESEWIAYGDQAFGWFQVATIVVGATVSLPSVPAWIFLAMALLPPAFMSMLEMGWNADSGPDLLISFYADLSPTFFQRENKAFIRDSLAILIDYRTNSYRGLRDESVIGAVKSILANIPIDFFDPTDPADRSFLQKSKAALRGRLDHPDAGVRSFIFDTWEMLIDRTDEDVLSRSAEAKGVALGDFIDLIGLISHHHGDVREWSRDMALDHLAAIGEAGLDAADEADRDFLKRAVAILFPRSDRDLLEVKWIKADLLADIFAEFSVPLWASLDRAVLVDLFKTFMLNMSHARTDVAASSASAAERFVESPLVDLIEPLTSDGQRMILDGVTDLIAHHNTDGLMAHRVVAVLHALTGRLPARFNQADSVVKKAVKDNLETLIGLLRNETFVRVRSEAGRHARDFLNRMPERFFDSTDREYLIRNFHVLLSRLENATDDFGVRRDNVDVLRALILRSPGVFADDDEMNGLISTAAETLLRLLETDDPVVHESVLSAVAAAFERFPRILTGPRGNRLAGRAVSGLIGNMRRPVSPIAKDTRAATLALILRAFPEFLTRENFRSIVTADLQDDNLPIPAAFFFDVIARFGDAAPDSEVRAAAQAINKALRDVSKKRLVSDEKEAIVRLIAQTPDFDLLLQVLQGSWNRYQDWREKAAGDLAQRDMAESFFWNVIDLLLRTAAPPSGANREPPRPINRGTARLAAGAAAALVAAAAGFWGWQAVSAFPMSAVLFAIPALFVLQAVLVEASIAVDRWIGGWMPTGPPLIPLWGLSARPKAGVPFVQFDPATRTYEVNRVLHALLAFNLNETTRIRRAAGFVVRALTHTVLNVLLVPLHEWMHAKGFKSEWAPIAAQAAGWLFVAVKTLEMTFWWPAPLVPLVVTFPIVLAGFAGALLAVPNDRTSEVDRWETFVERAPSDFFSAGNKPFLQGGLRMLVDRMGAPNDARLRRQSGRVLLSLVKRFPAPFFDGADPNDLAFRNEFRTALVALLRFPNAAVRESAFDALRWLMTEAQAADHPVMMSEDFLTMVDLVADSYPDVRRESSWFLDFLLRGGRYERLNRSDEVAVRFVKEAVTRLATYLAREDLSTRARGALYLGGLFSQFPEAVSAAYADDAWPAFRDVAASLIAGMNDPDMEVALNSAYAADRLFASELDAVFQARGAEAFPFFLESMTGLIADHRHSSLTEHRNRILKFLSDRWPTAVDSNDRRLKESIAEGLRRLASALDRNREWLTVEASLDWVLMSLPPAYFERGDRDLVLNLLSAFVRHLAERKTSGGADLIRLIVSRSRGVFGEADARANERLTEAIAALVDVLPGNTFLHSSDVLSALESILVEFPQFATRDHFRGTIRGGWGARDRRVDEKGLAPLLGLFGDSADADVADSALAIVHAVTDLSRPDSVTIAGRDGEVRSIAVQPDELALRLGASAHDAALFDRVIATLSAAFRRWRAIENARWDAGDGEAVPVLDPNLYFSKVVALLMDRLPPGNREDAQPINLRNAAGAFAVSSGLAVVVWAAAAVAGAGDVFGAWPAVAMLGAVPALFALLVTSVLILSALDRWIGSRLLTGPPISVLWGRPARAAPGTPFVQYDTATQSFAVNRVLYALLHFAESRPSRAGRLFGQAVRFLTLAGLYWMHVPRHEGRHAGGDSSEWNAYFHQALFWTGFQALAGAAFMVTGAAWTVPVLSLSLPAIWAPFEARQRSALQKIDAIDRFYERAPVGFFSSDDAGLTNRSIDFLAEELGSPDPEIRARSAAALVRILTRAASPDAKWEEDGPGGEAVRGAFRALIGNLGDPNAALWLEPLEALGELDSDDRAAVEAALSPADAALLIDRLSALAAHLRRDETYRSRPARGITSLLRWSLLIHPLEPAAKAAAKRGLIVAIRSIDESNIGDDDLAHKIFDLLVSHTGQISLGADDDAFFAEAISLVLAVVTGPNERARRTKAAALGELLRMVPRELCGSDDTETRAVVVRAVSTLTGELRGETDSAWMESVVALRIALDKSRTLRTRGHLQAILHAAWDGSSVPSRGSFSSLIATFEGVDNDEDVRSVAVMVRRATERQGGIAQKAVTGFIGRRIVDDVFFKLLAETLRLNEENPYTAGPYFSVRSVNFERDAPTRETFREDIGIVLGGANGAIQEAAAFVIERAVEGARDEDVRSAAQAIRKAIAGLPAGLSARVDRRALALTLGRLIHDDSFFELLRATWNRYEDESADPSRSDLAERTFWNVMEWVVAAGSGDPADGANAIDARNAAAAFGVSALVSSVAAGAIGTIVGTDVVTNVFVLAPLAAAPALFGVLAVVVVIIRVIERVASPHLPAAPPVVSLWGRPARAAVGAAFIQYHDVTESYEVNPLLFSLLAVDSAERSVSKRLIRRAARGLALFALNLLLVPVHEKRHARGSHDERIVYAWHAAVALAWTGAVVLLVTFFPIPPAWAFIVIPPTAAAFFAALEIWNTATVSAGIAARPEADAAALNALLDERPDADDLKRRLFEVVARTPLKLELDRLAEGEKTGTALGDVAEVVSRRLADRPVALRKAGDAVRFMLTGEAGAARPLFGGSLHGLMREIRRPVASPAKDLSRPQIIIQLTDDAVPDHTLALARNEIRKAENGAGPVVFRFVTGNACLRNRLAALANEAPANVTIEAHDRGRAVSLSLALESGVVTHDELQTRLFRFIAPDSMKGRLASFLDFDEIEGVDFATEKDRFRIYLMLTDTLNPLTVEFEHDRLRDLDGLIRLVRVIRRQA